MKYTPGKLYAALDGAFRTMIRAGHPEHGRKLMTTWVQNQPKTYEANLRQAQENEANAERMVACWNAMDGVDDPAALRRERDEFQKILAELAVAADAFKSHACRPGDDGKYDDGYDTSRRALIVAIDKAKKAAILKTEGGDRHG